MVQSIDNMAKPIYNAVNINIRKPEVNAGVSNPTTIVNDNGYYNAVKIDIDNPTVNTEPKKVYDYPQSEEIVTYDMAGIRPVKVPYQAPVAEYYEETIVIPEETKEQDNETEKAKVPAPNYTNVEAEKNLTAQDNGEVSFHGKAENVKKPEIVPAEEIKPDVDIAKVLDNLENKDFDVQAKQMEEIARIGIKNPEAGKNYIVKDVFSSLIAITKKDSSNLEPPTEKQIDTRKKIIANFVAAEIAKSQNKEVKLPYQLTKEEVEEAEKISPMEQAERNKEYAIYTMAVLAKIYTDEVEKHTKNVVPFTDVPGLSAIVDAMRYNQNAGVKIAAMQGLRHIARPEYKDEMAAIFSIAKNDKDPQVAKAAELTLESLKELS